MERELCIETAEAMRARTHVYALLSRCFETEMDADFAGKLCNGFEFASDDEVLNSSMAEMRRSLDGIDADGLEQMAVVFDRVFFGMGPRTEQKAFPYESVYTSDRGLMMQDAYSDAVDVYRKNALRKSDEFTEPEDHIAVELAFLEQLCMRAAAAAEEDAEDDVASCLAEQLEFLRGHLLNWTGAFCHDLHAAAEGGFYSHLATFTQRFLEMDASVVEEMIA